MKSYGLMLLAALVGMAGCSPAPEGAAKPAANAPADAGAKTAPVAPTAAPAKPAGPLKVAFVTNNASDFWTIAKAGTEKAKKELGCEVLFRIPAAGTAQEQQQSKSCKTSSP